VVIPSLVQVSCNTCIIFIASSQSLPGSPVSTVFEVHIDDPSLVRVARSVNRTGQVSMSVWQFNELSTGSIQVIVLWLTDAVWQPKSPCSSCNIQRSEKLTLTQSVFTCKAFDKFFGGISDG